MTAEQATKLQQVDHWQMLRNLQLSLSDSAAEIEAFIDSTDRLDWNREDLLKEVGMASALLEVVKMKFSMHTGEAIKKSTENAMIQLIEMYCEEENFDEMEF